VKDVERCISQQGYYEYVLDVGIILHGATAPSGPGPLITKASKSHSEPHTLNRASLDEGSKSQEAMGRRRLRPGGQ